MPGRSRAPMRDLAAIALLAALSVGMLWRCNLTGKAMVPGDLLLVMEPWKHYAYRFPEFRVVGNPILDAIQQFYPWRQFAGESLGAGEIPLWNPHELCGNPFVGNNQSAVFYPETWLHALMPTDRALGWATSLCFFIAGALMYWFLRLLRLRRGACLLGAIAFMFNGFIIGWSCFPSFRSVPAWLPGMLLGFELALGRRRAQGIALMSLFTGLQFLAGNLHISLYCLMVFSAYVVFRCLTWGPRRREALPAVVGALAALGIGGLLASVQLLPTLELAGMSSRAGGTSYANVLRHALASQALLTGLMPDLLGNPVDLNHWGAELGKVHRAYTESAFYVGVAPLLLAPLAFVFNRREGLFWVGVLLAGALLATGTHLNALLYYLVPSFKALSGIGRAVLLMSVALSVLGALGMNGLLELAKRDPRAIPRLLLLSGGALGLLGVIAGLWVWMATGAFERAVPGIGDYTLAQIGRFMALLVVAATGGVVVSRRHRLGAIIVLGCLAVDMYLFVGKFTPAVDPEYLSVRTDTVGTIQADPTNPRVLSLGKNAIHRMSPNTPMIVGLEDIQGSDSLEIGPYRRLLKAGYKMNGDFGQPDPSLPLIDLLGVKYVHSSYSLEDVAKLELLFDTEGLLYRNRGGLPRAFSVPAWRATDDRQALEVVSSGEFEPTQEAIITGNTRPATAAVSPSDGSIAFMRQGPNAAQLQGKFVPGQLVVVAEAYYPGWRAFAAGREVPIMRTDYALRSIQIQSPCDQVTFIYAPGSFGVGLFLTLIALCITSALWTFAAVGRRRG